METVGGLLAQRLGRVPIAGSVATVAGLRLTAESLAGRRNRIGTVTVERTAPGGNGREARAAAGSGRDGRRGRRARRPRARRGRTRLGRVSEAQPGPEDLKIITLARAARARVMAAEGAAVRDETGRTYAAAAVALPSLRLSALHLAVAMAVSSGAASLEAAAAGQRRRRARPGRPGRGARRRPGRRRVPRGARRHAPGHAPALAASGTAARPGRA